MRLERLTPDRLAEEQLTLYETIAGGPRAQGKHFPLIDSEGGLTGPFGIMLHGPALGLPLQELGAAIRYRTSLSDRIREIAILCVAAETDSAFERYAHERVGRAAGLGDAELVDLAAKRFSCADPVETAAYALCRRLLAGHLPMSDEDYGALRGILGELAIFELITLVGYYRTLAQLLHVFDVGVPEGGGA